MVLDSGGHDCGGRWGCSASGDTYFAVVRDRDEWSDPMGGRFYDFDGGNDHATAVKIYDWVDICRLGGWAEETWIICIRDGRPASHVRNGRGYGSSGIPSDGLERRIRPVKRGPGGSSPHLVTSIWVFLTPGE